MFAGCHTDGERDRHRLARTPTQRNSLALDGDAQPVGDLARRVHHRAREQDDELVARVPPDHVTTPDAALEQSDDSFQDIVSLKVAVRVVHELEMIDVDDEQRRRWIAGAAAEEGIVRGVEERAPNEHAGEVIHFARRVRRRRGGLLRWGCRGIREAAPQWAQAAHDGLEQRKELRIELAADVAPHHVQSLVMRHSLLIASLRRQRVVDVGNAENACGAGNLLGLEPVGIAGAVPTLVMRFDDRPHVPRKVDVGEHLDAPHRMLLDHHPFLRR